MRILAAIFVGLITLFPLIAAATTPTILDTIPSSTLFHTVNGTSVSFTYTVPAGGSNNCLIVLWVSSTGSANGDVSAISQNGTDFTSSIVHISAGTQLGGFEAWLANPSTGTFSMTWSPTRRSNIAVFTIQNCKQTTALDAWKSNTVTPTGTTLSVSTTTTVGNDIDFNSTNSVPSGTSPSSFGAGEAEITHGSDATSNANVWFTWKAAAAAAGTETVTTNYASGVAIDMSISTFKFQAAAAAATSPPIQPISFF